MSTSRLSALAPWLWCAFVAVCIAFTIVRFRVETSVTHFIVSPQAARHGSLLRALSSSDMARTMVFTVAADDLGAAIEAGRELERGLAADPEVEWIRGGVDEALERGFYDLYYPRRFAFASDRPTAQLPERLSDEGLRAGFEALKRDLAGPAGSALARLAREDPWLFFWDRMQALRRAQAGGLEIVDGRFVSVGGDKAVVLLGTRHGPFDSAHQGPLHEAIEATIAELESSRGVTIERSAIARFALASEAAIRGDIQRISTISMIGVVVLFVGVLGSLRLLGLSLLPIGMGFAVGCSACLLAFGQLHALTLAFGGTLIGVAVDYPAHLFAHHVGSRSPSPEASMRTVWNGLLLGAITTVAGFVGLASSSFPGIREIGLFASVGVAAALLSTRFVVPPLMPRQGRPGLVMRKVTRWGAAALAAMDRHRRVVIGLPVLAAVVIAIGLPGVRWVDDTRALNRLQPAALEEDERVRADVARMELGRLVVAIGQTEEEALQRNAEVARRLGVGTPEAAPVRSVHPLLWPASLQAESDELVRAQPDLAARTRDALAAVGFRPEAFADLEALLRAPPPEPLRFETLLDSPLAPLVRPHRIELDDGIAIVTFLTAGADADAISAAVGDLPGVMLFDQTAFMADTYRDYRARTLPLLGLGLFAIAAVLVLRYRSIRRAGAAFLPAVLAAGTTAAVLSLAGIELHLLHLVGLLLVLSMGVDYGVFLAESRAEPRTLAGAQSQSGTEDFTAVTLVGLGLACGSTLLGFGLLAMSSNPALSAVGITTGLGVLLSWILAPTTLMLLDLPSPGPSDTPPTVR